MQTERARVRVPVAADAHAWLRRQLSTAGSTRTARAKAACAGFTELDKLSHPVDRQLSSSFSIGLLQLLSRLHPASAILVSRALLVLHMHGRRRSEHGNNTEHVPPVRRYVQIHRTSSYGTRPRVHGNGNLFFFELSQEIRLRLMPQK